MAPGVRLFRARLRTLVKDYSVWDEAYAAVTDDRVWLYNNIGTAPAEIGTLDSDRFRRSAASPSVGWVRQAARGRDRPAAADVARAIIVGMLEGARRDGSPTLLAASTRRPWAFPPRAVSRWTGRRKGSGLLPIQIHGLRLRGSGSRRSARRC